MNETASDKRPVYSAEGDKRTRFPYTFQGNSTECYPDFHFGSFHDDSGNLEAGCHNMTLCQADPDNGKFHRQDLCADRTAA